jgi:hypothetical protein
MDQKRVSCLAALLCSSNEFRKSFSICLPCRRDRLTASPAYNDIATWNHQDMLRFFGAKDGKACSREVRTKEEFEEVSRLPEYTQPSSIQVSS